MAYEHSLDTDDGAIPAALRHFLRRRAFELSGLVLLAAIMAAGLALASWNVTDPSFNHATETAARNWLGFPGAALADQVMQLLGLSAIPLLAIPMTWVSAFFRHESPARPFRTLLLWLAAVIVLAGFLSALPTPSRWPLTTGFGGNTGDILAGAVSGLANFALPGFPAALVSAPLFLGLGLWLSALAAGLSGREAWSHTAGLGRWGRHGLAATSDAALGLWHNLKTRRRIEPVLATPRRAAGGDDIIARLAPGRQARGERAEPQLTRRAPRPEPERAADEDEDSADEDSLDAMAADDEDEAEDTPLRVTRSKRDIKPGRKLAKDLQPGFTFVKPKEFELPSLAFLSEPKRSARAHDLSDEVLEQNARMLEGVLEDFGIRGEIINVHPGPVVTLYELEPAPGIKSSRIISLADDIARSMSAVSARVAVVQGRNVIGIELPNAKRETVYLRELLASEAFEKTSQTLSVALGKTIGGDPVFADLARMPHLLIAGTTGSGKSVGINTMILSLLYRLGPERCKLIMIDPKMLELSVYEGIPHLLAPVVTDPRKAVVALKWAVREMEDRYRKMSKVGVRNIDGYNTRLRELAAKGQKVARTVQTGFDPKSGEPIFEQEEMDATPMPYIVVIIDEMADLMMVAGKDIEGAVQRLAQMARAAGIHVVMATQRPSVDVITGTIKANFPTRISFQVTSKIDSRTILGEQGAEQLLGQGDMLYMAGGGRISRLHGPFVSDAEVEKIVKHLKTQGAPNYVEAVTEDPEEGFGDPGAMLGEGGSGDDLYDHAVAVVLRDKKVSTSYVQRRLQVGYNKAASLIERMEKEGLISPANATGKREILVPGDSAD